VGALILITPAVSMRSLPATVLGVSGESLASLKCRARTLRRVRLILLNNRGEKMQRQLLGAFEINGVFYNARKDLERSGGSVTTLNGLHSFMSILAPEYEYEIVEFLEMPDDIA
jgi:hypothetical protein